MIPALERKRETGESEFVANLVDKASFRPVLDLSSKTLLKKQSELKQNPNKTKSHTNKKPTKKY